MPNPTETPGHLPEPSNLKFLRILVTVLTATMIIGMIGIFLVMFLRLSGDNAATINHPSFALPADVAIHSISYTDDHVLIIGNDNMLYVYDIDKNLIKSTSLD